MLGLGFHEFYAQVHSYVSMPYQVVQPAVTVLRLQAPTASPLLAAEVSPLASLLLPDTSITMTLTPLNDLHGQTAEESMSTPGDDI